MKAPCGFASLSGLSGGVWEWEDSCDGLQLVPGNCEEVVTHLDRGSEVRFTLLAQPLDAACARLRSVRSRMHRKTTAEPAPSIEITVRARHIAIFSAA